MTTEMRRGEKMDPTIVMLVSISILGASAVLDGVVLSILWAWFIVPMGAPRLTVPIAIGVSLIIKMLINPALPKRHRGEMMNRDVLAAMFQWPIFALIIGAIVQFFVR